MKRIFFVEDDQSLINGLSFALKKQGYDTDIARTKQEAETLWTEGKYDLAILDVSLPDGSGYEICEKIRRTSKIPIMFLTAADEETDIIMGLDIGGDDYITKPFKLAVLMSRINALLRRSGNFSQEEAELSSNGITVKLLKGKIIGLSLHMFLFDKMITNYFGDTWCLPVGVLAVILVLMFLSSAAAVYKPAKRIKNMAVTDTINEL